ncbi:hypothetical protein ACFLUZ_01835 [Chloroflexota bacterium]
MTKGVIYFPYIRVPRSEWFTRVLLYWDQVSSIVPFEYIRSNGVGCYMESLIEEGLVRSIKPTDYIYQIPHFEKAFLQYVDHPCFPIPMGTIRMLGIRTLKIHMEKLGSVGDELCQRGLARLQNYPWYEVEKYTANQFMAYLAAVLGKLPNLNSQPITDSIQNLNSFKPGFHANIGFHGTLDSLRTVVLKDVLPAPQSGIKPGEIARFKQAHRKELTRFRNHIESYLLLISTIDNPDIKRQALSEFSNKLQDEVSDISDLMLSEGWNRISLGRFLAYSTAVMGLSTAIITESLPAIITAALGTASSIYTTIKDTKAKNIVQGNYAGYAVLSQRAFGPVSQYPPARR